MDPASEEASDWSNEISEADRSGEIVDTAARSDSSIVALVVSDDTGTDRVPHETAGPVRSVRSPPEDVDKGPIDNSVSRPGTGDVSEAVEELSSVSDADETDVESSMEDSSDSSGPVSVYQVAADKDVGKSVVDGSANEDRVNRGANVVGYSEEHVSTVDRPMDGGDRAPDKGPGRLTVTDVARTDKGRYGIPVYLVSVQTEDGERKGRNASGGPPVEGVPVVTGVVSKDDRSGRER